MGLDTNLKLLAREDKRKTITLTSQINPSLNTNPLAELDSALRQVASNLA